MDPGSLGSDHCTLWSPTHFTSTTTQAGFDAVLHITDGNPLPKGKITFQNHSARDPWIKDANVRQTQNSTLRLGEKNQATEDGTIHSFIYSPIRSFIVHAAHVLMFAEGQAYAACYGSRQKSATTYLFKSSHHLREPCCRRGGGLGRKETALDCRGVR